jgi:hypothetical protein
MTTKYRTRGITGHRGSWPDPVPDASGNREKLEAFRRWKNMGEFADRCDDVSTAGQTGNYFGINWNDASGAALP